MALENVRKHEVAFCAEVSKWADRLFGRKGDLPFGSSDIESFGRGSHKRQDFRVYARSDAGRGPLALCGEVKLPETHKAGHRSTPLSCWMPSIRQLRRIAGISLRGTLNTLRCSIGPFGT